MGYSTLQIGTTGPSERIGGSSPYHIDTKFSTGLGWEGVRDRFDTLASRYKQDGRNIEFSNAGVGGLVYSLDQSPEERLNLLQRAASAHAPREGWHSFDYYAPTVGNDRWHSSAEGAPIYIVGSAGRKSEGGTGGNYGNYGVVLDENGNVVSKSGHGDNSGSVFKGGTFGSPPPIDTDDISASGLSTAADIDRGDAKERAQNYATMSKAELDSAYDAMRSTDAGKARIEGMKMHKARFGKI